ncbi:MAG: hypothetical protein HRT64_03840, partial [Erythrobacter sp.]|nr:hypothetical protein [Erythrobacter sp.]
MAAQAEPEAVPYGLWIWEAPETSNAIDLAIAKQDNSWVASINGESVTPIIAGQDVSLVAPDGDRFQGIIADDGSEIVGYWIQPQSRTGFSEMATHTSLAKTGSGQWAASFKEQARPFRVYLDLFKDEEGAPRAALRNPERNEIVRSSGFAVQAKGNGLFE